MVKFKIQHVDNKQKISIDGSFYVIYESYIVNGSGYSFGVKGTDLYFYGMSNDKIIILGKQKNYLLTRNKNKKFHFDKKAYSKNEILVKKEKQLYSVYFKGEIFESFYTTDNNLINSLDREIRLASRKEKLQKIENQCDIK